MVERADNYENGYVQVVRGWWRSSWVWAKIGSAPSTRSLVDVKAGAHTAQHVTLNGHGSPDKKLHYVHIASEVIRHAGAI